jgi:hypothetical protein
MMATKQPLVYLSPTGIQDSLICPARLYFSQSWERRKESDNFGSQVHRHMKDGTGFDAKADFASVEPILRKLREMEKMFGYTVLGREVEQVYELYPGVVFKRIMDAIVRMPTGRLTIVDYKSSSKPWKVIIGQSGEEVSPKAMTLQGAGYLLPPAHEVLLPLGSGKDTIYLDKNNWPRQALFINAPAQGDARWFLYPRNELDEGSFLRFAVDAAKTVASTADEAHALKNRGDHCDGRWVGAKGQEYGWACPWLERCYQQPNYERVYKKKRRKK